MSRFRRSSQSPQETQWHEEPSVNQAFAENTQPERPGQDSTKSYVPQPTLPRSYRHHRRRKRRFIFGSLILITLITIGAGGYFFLSQPADNENEDDSQIPITTPTQVTQQVTQTVPTPITYFSDEIKRYKSDQFSLSLDVPADWKIKDDEENKLLTITSPTVSIPTGSSSYSGVVVLTVQPTGKELTIFEAGNSIAAVASEKITYSQASAVQRGQTFVSFLGYAGAPSAINEIDGVYITGDFGYEKDQAIPEVDIKNVDPNIFVEFFICDGMCDIPLAIPYSIWQDPQFGGKIENMLVSLTIN